MVGIVQEVVRMLHPHYVMNVFLALSFFILKITPPWCYLLFEDCQLELKEWEWLTFLGCIIVMKNRKQPTYKTYIATTCMFGKALNALLYFKHNPVAGVFYILLCFLHIAFLPEPAYTGPDLVTYFRGTTLQEELDYDKRVTWIVEFYAAWSPACVSFASEFAQLSAQYTLDNLKFGKLDVTRFPKEAEKYMVDGSSWSKQLPTVIMFQGGKESRRRPVIDTKGRVLAKFIFSKDNLIRDFELNDLFLQCKKNPIHKKKKSDLNTPQENGATQGGKSKSE